MWNKGPKRPKVKGWGQKTLILQARDQRRAGRY